MLPAAMPNTTAWRVRGLRESAGVSSLNAHRAPHSAGPSYCNVRDRR